jgi:hypothetical protein
MALEQLQHPSSRGDPLIARSGHALTSQCLAPRRSKAHDHDAVIARSGQRLTSQCLSPRRSNRMLNETTPVIARSEQRPATKYLLPRRSNKRDQRTPSLRGASTMVASKYLPPRRSNHCIYHPFTSPHKSFHPGFISSINFIFRAREPPFMRFSSAIASSIVRKKRK